MPSDPQLIIINNNALEFDASSFVPEVPIPPIVMYTIMASGSSLVHGQKVCIQGDEKKVKKVHQYNSPPFPVPGAGTFEILMLASDQMALNTLDSNKPVITKGVMFDAGYTVNAKAILPTPKGPEDDKSPMYKGKGKFINLPNTDVYAK